MEQSLIVVCGWPLSGKSTIANELSTRLMIYHLDIDDSIRRPVFGLPHPRPNESSAHMERDVEEMAASYELLLHATQLYLQRLKRSLIVTATFSRKEAQLELLGVLKRNPQVRSRVIWCLPVKDSENEVRTRLMRGFGEGAYTGSVTTLERYLEVKERFQRIELPHTKIDTFPPNSIERCVAQALAYVTA